MSPRPDVLAHRGASAEFVENSVLAIVHALEDEPRADGFECDVRLTRDGVPMVFHDDGTLDLAGVPGTIEARSAAEVASLEVRGEPIPGLADLVSAVLDPMARLGRAVANIELKPTGAPEPLLFACRPHLERLAAVPGATVVVSSFDPRVVAAVQSDPGPWRVAFLYETLDALSFLPLLEARGPLDLHPAETLVDAAHLGRLAGPEWPGFRRAFRAWTVDDPARARALAALGVDGIITNRPRLLRAALDAGAAPDGDERA